MDWSDTELILGWQADTPSHDATPSGESRLIWHIHPLPDNALSGGQIIDPCVLSQAIDEALASASLGPVEIVMALSVPQLIYRWVELGDTEGPANFSSTTAMRRWVSNLGQVERPLQYQSLALDVRIELIDGSRRAWLVGVENDTVQAWCAVFKKTQAHLGRLDARPSCVVRACSQNALSTDAYAWIDGHGNHTQWGVAVGQHIQVLGECNHQRLTQAEYSATLLRHLSEAHSINGLSCVWVVGSIESEVVDEISEALGQPTQRLSLDPNVCIGVIQGLL